MSILDKIEQKEAIEREINSFFEKVVKYYLENSENWKNHVNKYSYTFSGWDESDIPGQMRISIGTHWGDFEYFNVSWDIIKGDQENWQVHVDNIIKHENDLIDEARNRAKKRKEKEERKLLAKLQEKYKDEM